MDNVVLNSVVLNLFYPTPPFIGFQKFRTPPPPIIVFNFFPRLRLPTNVYTTPRLENIDLIILIILGIGQLSKLRIVIKYTV